MKKELIIFSLIFLFSMSFISAFSWSDLLPSGYAVSDSAVDSVDEDCVSKCLNNICSDFTSSLRKRLCLNSDVRKQQCESECIVGEETSSTSITGGEKEKTDSTSATDNNQIVKKPSAETSVNSNTASSSKTNPSVSANVSDDLTENIIPEVQANFTFPEEMQLWIEEQNKNYIKINGHVSGNPDYLEWDWGDSVVERSFFENEHWYNNLGDYEVKVTAYRNGNLIAKSNFIIIIEKLFTENVKDMSKYSDKEVFIISDKNWKEVLPLVPVTTWTGEENCNKGYGTPDNICVYPTLIYHEESRSFDADSIIYFMQQYNTQKATFIRFPKLELLRLMIAQPDFGVGLNSQQLKLIFPKDYFSYWGFYKDMVYVEDDYEKALLASSYASLINAPLIIKGTNLDKDAYFIADKNIICVGNVNRNCNEQYSLEELKQKYVDETNTDKIILVNPNDLDIKIDESFQPEKSANPINEIYGETSLSAPILAGAKHEIILSTTEEDYLDVDEFIENKINNLGIDAKYLTIIGSPVAIDDANEWEDEFGEHFASIDNFYYGDIDNDYIVELGVGRIYGITSADVSSSLARSVFYSEMDNQNSYELFNAPVTFTQWNRAGIMEKGLIEAGLIGGSQMINNEEFFDINTLDNKEFISYADHGWSQGWAGNISTQTIRDNDITLKNSLILSHACSTCAFRESSQGEFGNLFCSNLIRRGAIGFVGGISASTEGEFRLVPYTEYILQGGNIGNSFKEMENLILVNSVWWREDQIQEIISKDFHFALFGDPTFNFNLNSPVNNGFDMQIINESNRKRIYLNLPEVERTNDEHFNIVPNEDDFFFEQFRSPPIVMDQVVLYRDLENQYPQDYVNLFHLNRMFIFKINTGGREIDNIEIVLDPENNLSNLQIFNQEVSLNDHGTFSWFLKDNESEDYYIIFGDGFGFCSDGTSCGDPNAFCGCQLPPREDMLQNFPAYKYLINLNFVEDQK